MATCPRCGTTLKDEYGMSQCPNCGAFSFIDMDGIAVIQAEESIDVQPPVGGAASPPDFSDPIEDLVDAKARDVSFDETEAGDFKPFDPFEQMPSMEAAPTAESPQEFAAESAGGFGSEASTGDAGTNSDFGGDFQSIEPSNEPTSTGVGTTSGFNAGPKPMKAEPSFGPANDPLNLNDFANSELSAAKDGPLLFRVLISGIDTREIRDSIREVLQDPRFAWDSNEIFSKVSKGHLAINGLSPVKASILITRIKRLPVQIRWEQYAIAQGQP